MENGLEGPAGAASVLNEFLGAHYDWLAAPREEIPRASVVEYPQGYSVRLLLPGLKSEDVKVVVKPFSASVWSQRKGVSRHQTAGLGYSELDFEEFKRVVRFRAEVDVQKATAKLEGGVLVLRVPKKEPEAKLVKVE